MNFPAHWQDPKVLLPLCGIIILSTLVLWLIVIAIQKLQTIILWIAMQTKNLVVLAVRMAILAGLASVVWPLVEPIITTRKMPTSFSFSFPTQTVTHVWNLCKAYLK